MVPASSIKVPRVSMYSGSRLAAFGFGYGAFTLFGWLSQNHSPASCSPSCGPNPGMLASRFGLLPFRSPLLRKSMFLSFPPATQMFHFTGFPSMRYGLAHGYMRCTHVGFPIQISAALWIFAPPRGFSQLITSFFGS